MKLLTVLSFLSFAAAHQQPNLVKRQLQRDDVEECFVKECRKEVDKADKLVECQIECIAEASDNGRSFRSIGPSGSTDLLVCGSECADGAERRIERRERNIRDKKKDCEKDCEKKCKGKDNEDECEKECDKNCKDKEKKRERDAVDDAEDKYEGCVEECFEEPTFEFYVEMAKGSNLRGSKIDEA